MIKMCIIKKTKQNKTTDINWEINENRITPADSK